MTYVVKELFYSIAGEGAMTGRPAVFVRFSGCNLWSGYESVRNQAICQFCDTDFLGGERMSAEKIADRVVSLAPAGHRPWCVLTGGEPALQVDSRLIDALRLVADVAIETNGTVALKARLDWITVSPKTGTDLAVTTGDELKLVYPQPGAEPERYAGMAFERFYLQPMDGPDIEANTRAAIEYCLRNPRWRLSEQGHKRWGLK